MLSPKLHTGRHIEDVTSRSRDPRDNKNKYKRLGVESARCSERCSTHYVDRHRGWVGAKPSEGACEAERDTLAREGTSLPVFARTCVPLSVVHKRKLLSTPSPTGRVVAEERSGGSSEDTHSVYVYEFKRGMILTGVLHATHTYMWTLYVHFHASKVLEAVYNGTTKNNKGNRKNCERGPKEGTSLVVWVCQFHI